MSKVSVDRHPNKKVIFLSVLCSLLFILIIVAIIFFVYYRNKQKTSFDSQAKSAQIIQKVGQLYVLPAEDPPTVAEIRDKTSLSADQDFYKGAENGDYILVYTKSKIALLYRESINKLVRVSPVVPQSASQSRGDMSN